MTVHPKEASIFSFKGYTTRNTSWTAIIGAITVILISGPLLALLRPRGMSLVVDSSAMLQLQILSAIYLLVFIGCIWAIIASIVRLVRHPAVNSDAPAQMPALAEAAVLETGRLNGRLWKRFENGEVEGETLAGPRRFTSFETFKKFIGA